jgi:hypothetical protein
MQKIASVPQMMLSLVAEALLNLLLIMENISGAAIKTTCKISMTEKT